MLTWEKRKPLDHGHCLVAAAHYHTIDTLTPAETKSYVDEGYTVSRFCQREGKEQPLCGRPSIEEPVEITVTKEYVWAETQYVIEAGPIIWSDQYMLTNGWTYSPLLRRWHK